MLLQLSVGQGEGPQIADHGNVTGGWVNARASVTVQVSHQSSGNCLFRPIPPNHHTRAVPKGTGSNGFLVLKDSSGAGAGGGDAPFLRNHTQLGCTAQSSFLHPRSCHSEIWDHRDNLMKFYPVVTLTCLNYSVLRGTV